MGERLNLLRGDVPLPAVAIRESALAHNIHAMAEWTGRHGFLFAPHGKTTMCPQIFRRQLETSRSALNVPPNSPGAERLDATV